MILYVNEKNEIKSVNSTTDETLTALEVNDEGNPFADWSVEKICCYKVNVENGYVTMYTPYIETGVIERIDNLAKRNIELEKRNAEFAEQTAMLSEQSAMLSEQSVMLTECILELSGLLYA